MKRLPSPAMAVALVALVLSVGGNVTAAVLITSADIKDNSIRSIDIRDGTVRGADVGNASLTGADIDNKTLTGVDVKNNTLTGSDVNELSLDQVPEAGNAKTAGNAAKLNGLAANQLVRATTAKTTGPIEFTSCVWTTVMSKSVVAPTDGILLVWGSLRVSTGETADGFVRAVTDRTVATNIHEVFLDGTRTLDVNGAVAVNAGEHGVALQARACGAAVSTSSRTITTLFVPFGNTGQHGTLQADDPQGE